VAQQAAEIAATTIRKATGRAGSHRSTRSAKGERSSEYSGDLAETGPVPAAGSDRCTVVEDSTGLNLSKGALRYDDSYLVAGKPAVRKKLPTTSRCA